MFQTYSSRFQYFDFHQPFCQPSWLTVADTVLQWLEDRHSALQAISFVDDIGLVVECDELKEGTRQLECIGRDTMQWESDNKVEFEISKTEVLLFSRRRKVLRAATDVVVRIGEQSFAIKQEATKWLGFWLDPKLTFNTHFEDKMAEQPSKSHQACTQYDFERIPLMHGPLSGPLARTDLGLCVTNLAYR